jgi:aldehyde dehydrogenase (NAD+)
LLISNEWVSSSEGETYEVRNPADPNDIIGLFQAATPLDVDNAISAARSALPKWSRTPAPDRGEILHRASEIVFSRKDEIASALSREEGKTISEALVEINRSAEILRYYAGDGWRMGGELIASNTENQTIYTLREPVGVVTVITPWNFPFSIPTWKIAPALVYGNTVVFKAATLTPNIGRILIEILLEAGIPSGVVNYITGSGAKLGASLINNPNVDCVSFTGSFEVGSEVQALAQEGMARVQCEMGGKNPLIVMGDAELEKAVDWAVRGGYGVTGQACTATSRVIIEERVADEFVNQLAEQASKVVVGDGRDEKTQMGPVVSKSQLETDLKYLKIGREEGAQLVTGGSLVKEDTLFLRPTVFDHVSPEMRIAQEEIFGPVVCVIRAQDFDDALHIANNTEFGLSASIATNDLNNAFRFVREIEAGIAKVNAPTTGIALQAPFGGFKHSSANTFKEQGKAALDFYTRTKAVYISFDS